MPTGGNARSVHSSVNDLIKATILDIEHILKRLPQRGDRVDVVKAGQESNLNEINLCSRKNRSTSNTSVERCSTCGPSCASSSRSSGAEHRREVSSSKAVESAPNDQANQRGLPKAKGRIVPDSICVTPLESEYGMMIDMVLSVILEETSETKLIDVRVECPNFKPSRIHIGGKWYDVVDDGTNAHN
ncbi:hypothetical protein COOONC_25595 [Cooperia oncophora]